MVKSLALLKCIGKAALKAAVRAMPLGEVIIDLAHDVYAAWGKEKKEHERQAELQAIAQATAGEVHAQIQVIVREIAWNQPTEIQETIASYLHQVPVAIHQSLRRPSDPTGTTIPPTLQILKEEDLIPFLPTKLPRFKPGDRPLLGVDWELMELLGIGGFGEVWKARNPHFDSVPPVALKFCLDPSAKDRLLRHEAAVLNQVMRQGRHNGIIPLLRTYLSSDPPCLEYQYVEGGDLGGFLAQRPQGSRALPIETATTIILRLAKIVGYAHRLIPPIVHRDLKPANILLEKAPDNKFHLRIADFGIGGLAAGQEIDKTKRGMHPGELMTAAVRGAYTLLYASPQQIRGLPPDPRDDVHALGVIWYQLLTGDLGAGRPGGRGWRNRLTEKGMDSPLLDWLEACFEENPADRPADASVIAEALQKHIMDQVLETLTSREREILFLRYGLGDGHTYGLGDGYTYTPELVGGIFKVTPKKVKQIEDKAIRKLQNSKRCKQLLDLLEFRFEENPEDRAGELGVFAEALKSQTAETEEEQLYFGRSRVFLESFAESRMGVWRTEAEQGSPKGQWLYGQCLLEGIAVAQDEAKAAQLFRSAAERGDFLAQLSLGMLYELGRGLPQDDMEATRWFHMAAEQANEQVRLGISYIDLQVPGQLSSRPSADVKASWSEPTETPATIQLSRDQVYSLSVREEATDLDLVGLIFLWGIADLQRLFLRGCTITDAGLVHLWGLTSLRELNLKNPHITDAGMYITDAGLAHVGRLTCLEKLNLAGCERVTDEGLAHLRELSRLESLILGLSDFSIEDVQITDAGLAHLSSLSNLRHLVLKGCKKITDVGLDHLRNLIRITVLDLSDCVNITDHGLAHLTTLSNLSDLSLSCCKRITDVGLKHLSRLPRLRSLELYGSEQITDAGLSNLSNLTDLRELSLKGKQITNAGLAHLSKLTRLGQLELNDCAQITDGGLEHLRRLTSLRELELCRCDQITDAGITALQHDLPNCEISR